MALPKVHPPPAPSKIKIKLGRLKPLVMKVFPVVVAANLNSVVADIEVAEMAKLVAGKVIDPEHLNCREVGPSKLSVISPSSAPPAPPVVKSRHAARLVPVPFMVTVNGFVPVFDPASKITSSAEVGTPAPPAPPDEDAQFVVEVASQFPEPPTQ
jgi:hypothetical protein